MGFGDDAKEVETVRIAKVVGAKGFDRRVRFIEKSKPNRQADLRKAPRAISGQQLS
jgi:hypothetical protein